ncbi:MAG: aldo/keto reductase [Pseudomonadota bacterium]
MSRLPLTPLGRTGLRISRLGLGTVKIGRNTGVRYPSAFDLPDDRSVLHLLDTARELGINLLDTAPAYGSSEERLGRLLSDRHDWVLCGKAGETFHDGQSRFDFRGTAIRRSLERSLRRLRTDHLDILLLHSDGNDLAILEQTDAFETLERLRKEGLVRAIGLSGKTVEGGLLALARGADCVMVTFNPEAYSERPVIREAQRLQRGVLIKKALNSGHRANTLQDNMDFVFGEPGVSAAIIGTLNPDHLRADAEACLRALSAKATD